jgi:hypothetical protein
MRINRRESKRCRHLAPAAPPLDPFPPLPAFARGPHDAPEAQDYSRNFNSASSPADPPAST